MKLLSVNNLYSLLISNKPEDWDCAEIMIKTAQNKRKLKEVCKKLMSYSTLPQSPKHIKVIELLYRYCDD
jgi:hypothetical protein